jgi:hypothetical protein
MNPTFLQIWGVEPWQMGPFVRWKHSRRYYRFRSVVRMAFWISLCYLTLAMFLSLGL